MARFLANTEPSLLTTLGLSSEKKTLNHGFAYKITLVAPSSAYVNPSPLSSGGGDNSFRLVGTGNISGTNGFLVCGDIWLVTPKGEKLGF